MPNKPPTHKPLCFGNVHRPAGRRLSSHKRGYNGRWQKLRAAVLAQQPLCQCGPDCCPDGCHQVATEVDHKRPVHGRDDPLFYDEANLQPLAESCHSRKTARDRRAGLC